MERIRIEPTSRADVGDIIRHESGQTSVTTLGEAIKPNVVKW
ncbi:hypothetical protein [Bacteroides thetaiotaomicron]|nr:hypothetical protein [Bacteroides thetaiotaomicron]MCS3217517.1 hypothetical protein [Bacteroides thetaiotaomicron]MCS3218582.1 hypothetical protein [Bacteroides thetaiotaomicron]